MLLYRSFEIFLNYQTESTKNFNYSIFEIFCVMDMRELQVLKCIWKVNFQKVRSVRNGV